MKINKKELCLLGIYICISLIALFIIDGYTFDSVAIALLINVVSSVVVLFFSYRNLFEIPILFVFLLQIFHYGHYFIYATENKVRFYFDLRLSFAYEQLFTSAKYALLVISFFVIGVLVYRLTSKKVKVVSGGRIFNDKDIYTIGKYMIALGIIPRVYVDYSKFVLFANGSYLDTYNLSGAGILTLIATLFELGTILVILANRYNVKYVNKVMILVGIYQIVNMLKGTRQYQLVYLIILMYVYVEFVRKINFKRIVLFLCITFLGLHFLTAITEFRTYDIRNIDILLECIKMSFEENMVIEILNEFGGTMISLAYSMEYFPNIIDYKYGLTYISSFITIIPKVSMIFGSELQELYQYTYNFSLQDRYALGGSYIGELFANFGWFGIGISMLVGYLIAFVVNKYKQNKQSHNYINVAIWMLVFQYMLLWVRGYFSDGVRTIVYSVIFINLFLLFARVKGKYSK